MVKENSSTIKKKRKSANIDHDQDIDIYKKVVEFEEKEAATRSVELDSELFTAACQNIRKDLVEVRKLTGENNPDKTYDQKFMKLIDISVRVAVIKKLNRIDKIQHVFGKEQLTVGKQQCDSIKLDYQNLVYEFNHLLSEINKCMAFKSQDENIDLIPFEEFMQTAPKAMTKKFEKFDENNCEQKHTLRLARLEYELQQRKSLAQLCTSLEEEKKLLAADIVARKNKLEALHPLLTAVLNATKPLQEHLDLPIDQVRAEQKLANLLPDPLYIFYSNCISYNSVFDINLQVVIDGNQEEAVKWKETQTTVQDEEDSEPDIDLQEVEEVVEVKKRRHRKSIQVDPMEERKRKLLEVFPLSVKITMNIPDGGPSITMTVRYFTKLKIITVLSNVEIPTFITGNTAQEILSGDNILSELVVGDFGTDSPNLNTPYQLKKVGLGSFSSLVSQTGHAYNWAQRVCGLNFLMKQRCSEAVARTNVEMVMKTLYKRLVARTELAKQLQKFEQNLIPKIPANIEVAQNAMTTLTRWSSTTYQSFCQSGFTQALVEEEQIQPSDLFYSATFTRSTATLQALIVVKNSYPTPPPILSLSLEYDNTSFHSDNCDEIRDIERCLNTDSWTQGSSSASWLLSSQLTQLCSYLDVFLETYDPKSFPQNSMFLKSHCARNRRRPFKFRKVGTGIFTQY